MELLRIGMEDSARWELDGPRKIKPVGERIAAWRQTTAIPNALYAFTCGGDVLYIGKTTRTLSKRFRGYFDPGETQLTNCKCHEGIKKLLKEGKEVRIFVLSHDIPLQWAGYPVNLAAGLEDALVHSLRPLWNGNNRDLLTETQVLEILSTSEEGMSQALHLR